MKSLAAARDAQIAACARFVAEHVRALRAAQGLTRNELAVRSGLSPRALAHLESGSANLTLHTLVAVAVALGVDAPSLLTAPTLEPTSIVLVGLRGAGKSTVGRLVSERLALPFVEVDRLIERESGLSLSTLFELHGEPHVRDLEARVLARLVGPGSARSVIAAPGGVVSRRETWQLVRARAHAVWLKATPQEHWDRVRAQGDERPMAARSQARAELDALWTARAPLYAEANVTVDTSGKDVDVVVGAVVDAVGAG